MMRQPRGTYMKPNAEPCPACESPIYRRVVLTEITVHFDARMEYDGMYYYHRRHRCYKRDNT